MGDHFRKGETHSWERRRGGALSGGGSIEPPGAEAVCHWGAAAAGGREGALLCPGWVSQRPLIGPCGSPHAKLGALLASQGFLSAPLGPVSFALAVDISVVEAFPSTATSELEAPACDSRLQDLPHAHGH